MIRNGQIHRFSTSIPYACNLVKCSVDDLICQCYCVDMPATIKDEFECLPISRQYKYQLRKIRDGRCRECGKDSNGHHYCALHLAKRRLSGNKLRLMARSSVALAIRSGKLRRGNCWCGELGQAHHDDYSKPLKVKWLCHKHHSETLGKAAFSTGTPIKCVDSSYNRTYYQEHRERICAYQRAWRARKVQQGQ